MREIQQRQPTMATSRRCVYDCRHPLWGGNGTCSAHLDLLDDECLCDEGYATIDSLGNPSCVLSRGLLGLYVSMALCGAAGVGFVQWAAMKQRMLPTVTGATRRATLRMRLIRSASAMSGSSSICFCVATAHGNLYTSGMLQALYSTTIPLAILAAMHVVDLWVDTLPSRLLPIDGTAIRIINLAEKQNLFVWVGGAASTSSMLFGLLAFTPVLDTITVVRTINLVGGIAATCAALCLNLVGFYLTGLINTAMCNAGPSAAAFYTQALRTLRMQVFALSISAIVACASVIALEPRLAGVGERTPGIPLSAFVLDASVGLGAAVYFVRVGPAKGASYARSPAVVPFRAAASPGRPGPRANKPDVIPCVKSSFGQDTATTTTTATATQLLNVRPWSTPGDNRVVPTLTDDSSSGQMVEHCQDGRIEVGVR